MKRDSECVLRVTGLEVVIEGRLILEDLSFDVQQGEVVTILGPNGAGKTVLLNALIGTVPHQGTATWKPGVRFGYVPQRLPYIRNIPLSVHDFFALKRTPVDDPAELLLAVGMHPEDADRGIGDFSSGQFQRILIAWALASDPEVLLFDEPTTGIDIGGEETVYALLSRLHRERNLTMLIVTHDLAVVHRLTSTVLCLNRRILCMGPPREALTTETMQQLYGAEVTYYEHHRE